MGDSHAIATTLIGVHIPILDIRAYTPLSTWMIS